MSDPTAENGFLLPPPVPGEWTTLTGDIAGFLVARLRECSFGFVDLVRPALIRALPLGFWNGWFLCDVQPVPGIVEGAGATGGDPSEEPETPPAAIHSFVYGPDGFTPLDGTSPAIHSHNSRHGIDLSTEALQHDYLRFFCYFVRGELGPFEIVTDASRLRGDAGADLGRHVVELAPTTVEDDKPDRPTYKASIVYGDKLFNAVFALHQHGMIEMLDDEPLLDSVSLTPAIDFFGTGRSLRQQPEQPS